MAAVGLSRAPEYLLVHGLRDPRLGLLLANVVHQLVDDHINRDDLLGLLEVLREGLARYPHRLPVRRLHRTHILVELVNSVDVLSEEVRAVHVAVAAPGRQSFRDRLQLVGIFHTLFALFGIDRTLAIERFVCPLFVQRVLRADARRQSVARLTAEGNQSRPSRARTTKKLRVASWPLIFALSSALVSSGRFIASAVAAAAPPAVVEAPAPISSAVRARAFNRRNR